MVQSTSLSGEKTIHATKTAIEKACLEENDKRFQQSNLTPLQQPVAIELLGRTGITDLVDKILLTGKLPLELAEIDPFL